jgi:hypothetical protein
MLEPAHSTSLNRISPSPGKGESSRFVNTYWMAGAQLTFLHGLDHLLQHGDRFVGRRAVHRTLAGRIVVQLRYPYLYPVDRLILRHSSESTAEGTCPPPRLHCSSLTFLLRRQRDRVPTHPSKGAMRCTYAVYCIRCLMCLQYQPDVASFAHGLVGEWWSLIVRFSANSAAKLKRRMISTNWLKLYAGIGRLINEKRHSILSARRRAIKVILRDKRKSTTLETRRAASWRMRFSDPQGSITSSSTRPFHSMNTG